jgi:Holliday junction resolvasome RuvABC endonuclease subunit
MSKIPNKIFAIDASTNSLAFAGFSADKKELGAIGKIVFEGKDIYEKVGDAARKTKAFLSQWDDIDAIVIEHTVFMNSPKTAADLALVQGALLGAAATCGINVVGKVSPITWQNYLGNKKLTKDEQFLLRSKNPDKSLSWYKTYERNFRKERTMRLIDIIYDKKINDNDVADACGIGHWAINNWDKAI